MDPPESGVQFHYNVTLPFLDFYFVLQQFTPLYIYIYNYHYAYINYIPVSLFIAITV